jgi:hypothetical protein
MGFDFRPQANITDGEEPYTLDHATEDSVSDIIRRHCEVGCSHVVSCATILSSAPARLQSQSELTPARKKRSRDDDIVTDFFLNMAQTVKTFPPFLQAQVKGKVFSAVNSAELLMCNLGNPRGTSGASDYLTPHAVNRNPHCGARPPVQSPCTSCSPKSRVTGPVSLEPRNSAFSSHQWQSTVNSPYNDTADQKPVVANLLSSTRNSPSLSSESETCCETSGPTKNTAQARNT